MGATVTCNKLAAAFQTPGQSVTYVLFEEVYDKRTYPHTPKWSCYFIGGLAGALQHIFDCGASCEGGMLQTRKGTTTPEAYITAWLRELAAPMSMPDRTVEITATKSFYATIAPEAAGEAGSILASHGLHDEANSLVSTDATVVSLHRHTAAIIDLTARLKISTWRLIREGQMPRHEERRPDLGYKPSGKSSKTAPLPRIAARKVDHHDLLLQRADGSWYSAGWAYSIVGEHVRHGWEAEIEHPGLYRQSIPALRSALEAAPPIPAGTTVEVAISDGMENHVQNRCTEIRAKHLTTATANGFAVEVTPDTSYDLCHIPNKWTTWRLPDLDMACEPIPHTSAEMHQQLALL